MLTNKENITISGKTEPNAIVSVNGKTAKANDDGSFSVETELQPGVNEIVVTSKDTTGNEEKQRLNIYYDNTPPEINVSSPSDNTIAKENSYWNS